MYLYLLCRWLTSSILVPYQVHKEIDLECQSASPYFIEIRIISTTERHLFCRSPFFLALGKQSAYLAAINLRLHHKTGDSWLLDPRKAVSTSHIALTPQHCSLSSIKVADDEQVIRRCRSGSSPCLLEGSCSPRATQGLPERRFSVDGVAAESLGRRSLR